jgi:hypothetical protein
MNHFGTSGRKGTDERGSKRENGGIKRGWNREREGEIRLDLLLYTPLENEGG